MPDYTLHPHGRYSHLENYVSHVAAEAGLEMKLAKDAALLNGVVVPVDGLVTGA